MNDYECDSTLVSRQSLLDRLVFHAVLVMQSFRAFASHAGSWVYESCNIPKSLKQVVIAPNAKSSAKGPTPEMTPSLLYGLECRV